MKKCLCSSCAALFAAFSVSAAIEPLAALRIPSVEKLGATTTQFCGAIGQPMLGGMATGILQQQIQTMIGPFDQTKPVAIVVYGDTAKLETALAKNEDGSPMSALPDVKTGVILPISMSSEEFARSKLLKLNAEGVAQLPGTPMFITFKGQNAFIASDEQTVQRLKIEASHYQTVPANGDALSIEFFPPAISLYGNLIGKQFKEKPDGLGPMQSALMSFSLFSAAENKKQLEQLASSTLGLGYNQADGFKIGMDVRYKPGTELASLAAAAKPVKTDLLANVPDTALFCQQISMTAPDVASNLKNNQSNLVPFIQAILDASITQKYPALSKAITESTGNSMKILGMCEQCVTSFGYDKTSKFWGYSRFVTSAGQKEAVFQSVLAENQKLVTAVKASFPDKPFLTFDAPSATMSFDPAQFPVKEIVNAVNASGKNAKPVKDTELAEIETNVRNVFQALTGGQPIRIRTVKTADGYENIASCDGVANLPKFAGNGQLASASAKGSGNVTEFTYLDLFTIAKNVLEELAPKLSEDTKKELAPILAMIAAGGPGSGLTARTKTEGTSAYTEIRLPQQLLQKISAIVAAINAKSGDDDDQ
ncbi:MAG: hypothetical protein J6Z49_09145 [Kiritimatiellae bacterium]|nr:hypothetical protein [Kiritimatiellia bacterium]